MKIEKKFFQKLRETIKANLPKGFKDWFFSGHRNKLTAEVSYFDFQANPERQIEGFRFRIQWDISF